MVQPGVHTFMLLLLHHRPAADLSPRHLLGTEVEAPAMPANIAARQPRPGAAHPRRRCTRPCGLRTPAEDDDNVVSSPSRPRQRPPMISARWRWIAHSAGAGAAPV